MKEVLTMIYKICRHGYNSFEEIYAEDKTEAKRYILDHFEELQRFSIPEATRVFCYAAELNERHKPTAILIYHNLAQWIWIELE